ncbi:MAG: alpha/beta fold hydrolase [Ignavibacteriaceae bacterium]|nr:alpha/beta fold hydrolase [Ignavibacteriaceae bacterium]
MKNKIGFLFILITLSLLPLNAQNKFEGHWSGKLNFGSVALTIILNITADEDTLTATIDSPDQGAMGIPVSSVRVNGDSLFIGIKSIGGSYTARYIGAGDSVYLKGKFSQSGASLDLTLLKSDKQTVLNRPQEPRPPFPYYSEEIEFENKEAGVKFSGTFTRPDKVGRYAAVVLVTGSGPQDRDEALFGHKPFAVIADYLTRNGFAVLRYDERGVGKSTGKFAGSTTLDFTHDALAAIGYLKSRKDVNPAKTGIIGHSEGGVVAPMAAAMSEDVKFIIMLAGLGVPGDELLHRQYRDLMKAGGAGEEKIEKMLLFNRELYSLMNNYPDSSRFFEEANSLIEEFYKVLTDVEKENPEFSHESLESLVKTANGEWFRFFVKTNPAQYLSKVNVPVLALNGTKDLQVSYKENLDGIGKALTTAGNKNFTILPLEGLNHLFQKADKGTIDEYGKIEETINPEALEVMRKWLAELVKS